ncbi:hypothetical protein XM38_050730 [Halomicronema hongdechloris C2206]|uniref:Uncharacterized protein n=1 Tax=Halomicronema hongdechloris C2206 TaxID=1641165 RepID=A0A1Z3HUV2_9CYAN|nr:hypothetical protein XM38_050730 [Halomicronema hongdechloris C2206]
MENSWDMLVKLYMNDINSKESTVIDLLSIEPLFIG